MSDTRVTGNAKIVLSLSIVGEAEVELTTNTSGHFEKALTVTSSNVTTSFIEHDQCAISPMDCEAPTMDVLVLYMDWDSQHNTADSSMLFLQFLCLIEATTSSFMPATSFSSSQTMGTSTTIKVASNTHSLTCTVA